MHHHPVFMESHHHHFSIIDTIIAIIFAILLIVILWLLISYFCCSSEQPQDYESLEQEAEIDEIIIEQKDANGNAHTEHIIYEYHPNGDYTETKTTVT